MSISKGYNVVFSYIVTNNNVKTLQSIDEDDVRELDPENTYFVILEDTMSIERFEDIMGNGEQEDEDCSSEEDIDPSQICVYFKCKNKWITSPLVDEHKIHMCKKHLKLHVKPNNCQALECRNPSVKSNKCQALGCRNPVNIVKTINGSKTHLCIDHAVTL